MKKMKVTTPRQFDALIEEMGRRPQLAKCFKKGLPNFNDEWKEVARKVNIHGPPMREAPKWQRVWKDLKGKVKKKLVHNKSEISATGRGHFNQIFLTPNEEAVANLIQVKPQINPAGNFIGDPANSLKNLNESMMELDEEFEFEFRAAEDNPVKRKAVKKNSKTREILLEKQTNAQDKFFEEISASLKDVQSSLRDSARYQRKMFEIQEKRFKLYKSKIEKQEALMEQQRKIQKLDLDIKKKKNYLLDA